MKHYLKNVTKLNITRSVKNPFSSQSFTTTYSQAIEDNDFTTDSGTVSVSVELHDDEHKNFVGCNPTINYGANGLYVEEDLLYYIDPQGRIINERHGEPEVVYDPKI